MKKERGEQSVEWHGSPRNSRNETTRRSKGEEAVRPGIESVSNGHERGASRRQASSAD